MKKITVLFFAVLGLGIGAGKAQYTILYNFNGTTGANPSGSLTLSGNTLYGMTAWGGGFDSGRVFSIDTIGNGYSELWDFFHDYNGRSSGVNPYGDLTLSGNVFYGMTAHGGSYPYNGGCIFSYESGFGITYLHDFYGGSNDGWLPYGSLVLSGNTLYGMTSSGGLSGYGNIFSIDTNGNYTNIFFFNGINGFDPQGSLTLSGSTLYGMTSEGGTFRGGNIFKITTNDSNFTDLFDFNGTNGVAPYGSLILSGNTLYGMTVSGGLYNYGVIFSIDTNGNNYDVLFNFNDTNGGAPHGSLILSGNTLYGMTQQGGVYRDGVVFKIDTNGSNFRDMFDFNGTDGAAPYGSLILSGSTLYGMTQSGGVYGYGVVFKINTNSIASINNLTISSNSIIVSPNPASNKVFVTFSSNPKESLCQLYTITGQQVWVSTIAANTSTFEIPVGNLNSGIYFLKLQTGDGSTFTKKVEVIK